MRLRSIDQHRTVQQSFGLPRPDQIDQQLGIVQRIDQTQIGGGDPETGAGRGNANVAGEGKLAIPGYRKRLFAAKSELETREVSRRSSPLNPVAA